MSRKRFGNGWKRCVSFVLNFGFMFLRVFPDLYLSLLLVLMSVIVLCFWIAQLGDNCAGRREICGKDYGHKRVWDFMSEIGLRLERIPNFM